MHMHTSYHSMNTTCVRARTETRHLPGLGGGLQERDRLVGRVEVDQRQKQTVRAKYVREDNSAGRQPVSHLGAL